MGRKPKQEGMDVHIQLIHFAVQQKLTQHCKITIIRWKLISRKVKDKYLLNEYMLVPTEESLCLRVFLLDRSSVISPNGEAPDSGLLSAQSSIQLTFSELFSCLRCCGGRGLGIERWTRCQQMCELIEQIKACLPIIFLFGGKHTEFFALKT